MNKLFKMLIAPIAFCLLAISMIVSSTLYAESFPTSSNQPNVITPTEVNLDDVDSMSMIDPPHCTIYTAQKFYPGDRLIDINCKIFPEGAFNCMVVYRWIVGDGGTELSLSSTGDLYKSFGPVYDDIAMPDAVGYKTCPANYRYGYSFNAEIKDASFVTQIAWEQEYEHDPPEYYTRYEYDCKYVCIGKTPASYDFLDIPTKFDQNHFLWTHEGKSKQTIKGTIAFNGEISDIEVNIPMIGTRTAEVTLDGVSFYLRTGPNKCSIRAEKAVDGDLKFAFGVA